MTLNELLGQINFHRSQGAAFRQAAESATNSLSNSQVASILREAQLLVTVLVQESGARDSDFDE